jgi:hypothetical protein
MSFAEDTGYLPNTISDLMGLVRVGVNEQFGTSYDAETFLGTNFYKYFYALIQRLQEQEVKASEIVVKLQQYFTETNEAITRPNTTHPGIIDYLTAAGFTASTKAPIDADAGKLYVCVDLDSGAADYADTKLEVCTIIKDSCVAGVISQGTEVESITLSNSQSFDFKFNLPTYVPIILRLTITTSSNNQFTVLTTDEIRQLLFDNINERYRLGLNFEPQRYFSVLDAPWAASVLLEYSFNAGVDWDSVVYAADYDELLTFEIGDIEIVEV